MYWHTVLCLCSLVSLCLGKPTGFRGFHLDSTHHTTRTLYNGRTYLLYVPPKYTPWVPHPLVLSFHGANGNSSQQEKLSQFSDKGVRIAGRPVIAAYPQGVPNTTAQRSATWYSAPYANTTVDDIQFTKDIIADISAVYNVDQRRIYAAGKSNGGGFTAYLACRNDTSSLFAAFAPVSPALYPGTLAFSGCRPSRPVPIINSHGVVDQTIPFYGRNDSATGEYGVGSATINVPLWRRQWAARNGCSGHLPDPARTFENAKDSQEEVWDCDVDVEAFTGAKLGHSWPTTLGLDLSGAPNNTAHYNITSPAILDFFTRYALPKEHLHR